MAKHPPGRFTVEVLPAEFERVRVRYAREIAAGRGVRFLVAMREIDYRLRFAANEWGESRDYLPGLRLQRRFGTVGPISVWNAVHPEKANVFVRESRFRDRPPGG